MHFEDKWYSQEESQCRIQGGDSGKKNVRIEYWGKFTVRGISEVPCKEVINWMTQTNSEKLLRQNWNGRMKISLVTGVIIINLPLLIIVLNLLAAIKQKLYSWTTVILFVNFYSTSFCHFQSTWKNPVWFAFCLLWNM